jgi:hypothetical protein
MEYEIIIKKACTADFWSCLELTDWIQIVSVLIALLASFAAWSSAIASKKSSKNAEKQMLETYLQRVDSVRPELFLKNRLSIFFFEKNMYLGVFCENKNQLDSNQFDTSLYIEVVNVGEGHAKYIEIKWDLDLSSCITFIEEHQENNEYIIDYKIGNRIDFNESSSVYLDKEFESSEPIFITNGEYNIRLPYSYTRILSIYIHILNNKYKLNYSSDLLPGLKISISYKDILGNPYDKMFFITPRIIKSKGSSSDGKITNYELEVLMEIEEST